jgi:hypothetical protein
LDDNNPFVSAAADVEVIAGADRSTRLGTGSVECDFAGRDSAAASERVLKKRAAQSHLPILN